MLSPAVRPSTQIFLGRNSSITLHSFWFLLPSCCCCVNDKFSSILQESTGKTRRCEAKVQWDYTIHTTELTADLFNNDMSKKRWKVKWDRKKRQFTETSVTVVHTFSKIVKKKVKVDFTVYSSQTHWWAMSVADEHRCHLQLDKIISRDWKRQKHIVSKS